MNRPELQTLSITPNQVNTRATVAIVISVDDKEIVFGTEYQYARATNTEIFAGEEGVI